VPAAANLFAQPKPAAFLTTGSLLRRPPPRIASRWQDRQPFEQREVCCAGRRRESLRAGRTGSLLNNGKPAAPAAAVNLFMQAEPAAPPGRH